MNSIISDLYHEFMPYVVVATVDERYDNGRVVNVHEQVRIMFPNNYGAIIYRDTKHKDYPLCEMMIVDDLYHYIGTPVAYDKLSKLCAAAVNSYLSEVEELPKRAI